MSGARRSPLDAHRGQSPGTHPPLVPIDVTCTRRASRRTRLRRRARTASRRWVPTEVRHRPSRRRNLSRAARARSARSPRLPSPGHSRMASGMWWRKTRHPLGFARKRRVCSCGGVWRHVAPRCTRRRLRRRVRACAPYYRNVSDSLASASYAKKATTHGAAVAPECAEGARPLGREAAAKMGARWRCCI